MFARNKITPGLLTHHHQHANEPHAKQHATKVRIMGYLTYTMALLGTLPKAHAFFSATAGPLTPKISSAVAAVHHPSAAVRLPQGEPVRSWAGTVVWTGLRGLTDRPLALFVSGGGSTTEMSVAAAPSGGVKRVLVPVADGSEEIESVTIIDTLVRAGAVVTVASVGENTQVCACGAV